MPGLRNQGVHKAADFPKAHLNCDFITAINLTGAVVYSFAPGYRFQVSRIRSFCQAKAGTVTAVIKIGTRTAASIVFTAATEVAQTLSTTLSNLRGTSTEAITVELTTDNTGALTNGQVVITIRPWPLNGELGPST